VRWRHAAAAKPFALVLAFVLALGGQVLLNHDRLWAGAALYGIALLPVAWSARHKTVERPASPAGGLTRDLKIRQGAAKGLGLAAAAGVLAFSVVTYRDFGARTTRAWSTYLAGLGYLAAANVLLTRGGGLGRLWPRTRIERWLLAAVLLLAVVLRVWQLGSLPAGTWYDEALSGLQGMQWIEDSAYRPQFERNNPGQLIWLFATAQRWFGQGIGSIRLVSAFLGVAGVLAAYLFGSELRGPRFGLLVAFILAAARWHLNFSRIAMPGVDAPLFIFASLFFLTRLLHDGRLRDSVWAGLSLGLGLSAYSAFRLFVLAVAFFTFLSLLRGRTRWAHVGDRRGWLRAGVRLGTLCLALWLAALPVIQFSLSQPAAFWNRVRDTSVFRYREEPNLVKAIGRSTGQHLLMFHVAGDRNGRHNLYAEPTLDPVMGVLLFLGLALALLRIRRHENLFFVILLPVGLLGGILSLDFEAPQSLRSIAAMPAVIYFCALSFSTLVDRLGQSAQPRFAAVWRAVPTLALGGTILLANAHTYFVRQASDSFSWSAFSAAESIVGRRMAELGPGYSFYLSPLYADHPSIRFLAPGVRDSRPLDLPDALPIRRLSDRQALDLPDALPIRQDADRPAALFVHPDDVWVYDAARALYPGATFETVYDPSGHTPVLYVVTLESSDLAGIQGLELRAWLGPRWEGQPEAVVRVAGGETLWPESLPRTSLLAEKGTAEWAGVLYAPEYGVYRLALEASAGATLDVDSTTVVEVGENGKGTVTLALAQGNHSLRVRALSKPGQVRLLWQPPGGQMTAVPQWALYAPGVSYHGLMGSYYANENWEGPPSLARVDPFLDTYYHLTPLPRPYSVEWVGVLDVPQPGRYQLGLRAVDWAQLAVDGKTVLETAAPGEAAVEEVNLERGLYDLDIRYRDESERSRLHLLWRPPGQDDLEPIPAHYLWPSRAVVPANSTPVGVERTRGGTGGEERR